MAASSSAPASGCWEGSSVSAARSSACRCSSPCSASWRSQAVILNKAMSLVVVATALPARVAGVPFADLLAEWHVIVTLLGGSLAGAWLGAACATRMSSARLPLVIAALLALIAVALAADHVGTVPRLDLSLGPRIVAGLVAGLGIGVVAVLMGVAGGELLIPTIVLLYAVDPTSPAASRWPSRSRRCSSRSRAPAAMAASSSCAGTATSCSSWPAARSRARSSAACCWASCRARPRPPARRAAARHRGQAVVPRGHAGLITRSGHGRVTR